MTAELRHVMGDTWYIHTGTKAIPLWRAGGGEAVLIDSGDSGAERAALAELLCREGLHVSAILTTHAHRDHTANHRFFRQTQGSKIVAPLHTAGVLSSPLGLKSGFEASSLRETIGFAKDMLCQVDQVILPGQTDVTVADGCFSVLPLPGHAPDHTGYVTPDGVACLGDLFFTPDILGEVRLPYSFCWEIDLESRRRAATWTYPVSILAHNGVCGSLAEIERQNRALVETVMDLVLSLTTSETTFCNLLAQVNHHLSIGPGSNFKRDAVERSVRALAHYLQDYGQLHVVHKDGVVHYQALSVRGAP